MTPMLFCQDFFNQWPFCSLILQTHVLNTDTYVDQATASMRVQGWRTL